MKTESQLQPPTHLGCWCKTKAQKRQHATAAQRREADVQRPRGCGRNGLIVRRHDGQRNPGAYKQRHLQQGPEDA
jgi:hypothetical protein